MIGARPNKGLFDIVPIWRRVCKLRPDTSLVVMGGMSGEGEVAEEAQRLGLPVKFFKPQGGFLPTSQYHAKIKEARLLFAPSHEEGWGIAVCEAMAAGLPVIAYDLPAYQKIYPGAYARIPCFDKDKFASAIVDVLECASAYDDLRQKSAAAAEKYDWNQIAADDEAALND